VNADIKKGNLNEQVFHALKGMIIKGELKPGEKIVEANLSKTLNVSRTPIRDALRRLERESLVISLPSQGTQVTRLSKQNIINLYECRSVLEGLAVRQAIGQISNPLIESVEECIILAESYYTKGDIEKMIEKNTLFHDQLVASSKNAPLIQMMKNIRTQTLRYRMLTGAMGFRSSFIQEHTDILMAVKNSKPDLAETLMKRHILADLQAFLQRIVKSNYLDE
jgi:DNA-binding GntR family transcriptional regulator